MVAAGIVVFLLSLTSATDVVIENPAKAPRTQVVHLEELWRVGEDDEDVVFGAVGAVLVDRDGRVYVTDMQARQISVFSPEGEFLRHLGREGEGPGEFREPRSPVLLPNGNVGIVYEQPPRIVCYGASDGQFVEDLHLNQHPKHPFQRLSRVGCRGQTLIVYAADLPETPDGIRVTARLMRFDATGKFLGECESLDHKFDFANPVIRERYDLLWSIGPDERVYVNRGPEYGFSVYDRDCRTETVIAREYRRLKRSSAEMDSIREFYRRVGNIGNAQLEISDHARDVAWFSVDDAARLWVVSSRGRIDLAPDSLAHFDIYDARGRLERTVDLKAERGDRDWYHMHRDRFFVVHLDTMTVVAHRLPEIGR